MNEKKEDAPSLIIEAGCNFLFLCRYEIRPVRKANNSYFFSSGIFLI